VVLTGDHGESLGEHGEMTHGIFAYESTLRVPLVFFAPEILKPRVVATPVRHVDVLPTVLDALGLEPPAHLPGRSLLDVAARDEGAAEDSYFEALSPSLNQGWAPLRGILHDGLKYVELPIPELYNLTRDAAESKNLAASRPAELESMRALLSGLRRDERPVTRGEEEASARERLRALGYLAASGPSPTKKRYTEQDDPKQLIDIDRRQSDALGLYYAGDLGGAIALCRENIQRRPDMPMAYLHLASFERARGNLGAAVDALRQAVALRPLDMESVALLGVYLNEAGRSREAAKLLEPYAKAPRPDLDVLTARGVALATLGRNEEALAAFAAAREVDPSNAMVVVNVATVHLMADELDRARRMFEDALRIDPGLARAHNSLGVIAAREGRLDGAIEHWKRAAALDPKDYQTLFNLGSTLRRLGRDDEARPYLQAYVREAPASEDTSDLARVRSWLGERGQGGPGR
jgi:tetratricopeptide (TPR) repeat protein